MFYSLSLITFFPIYSWNYCSQIWPLNWLSNSPIISMLINHPQFTWFFTYSQAFDCFLLLEKNFFPILFWFQGIYSSDCSYRETLSISACFTCFVFFSSSNLLNNNHCNRCEEGLELHFSDNLWCWILFHIPNDYWNVFFEETSI